VLALAAAMKRTGTGTARWRDRRRPVLFDKPSLRTRSPSRSASPSSAGLRLVIDTQATHIGRGETIADMAACHPAVGGHRLAHGRPGAHPELAT